MPERTSTPSSRAEVRRRLEDAAADLFARKGFAGTTVDDIVEAAGMSKPALYRVFESKRDLHMGLLERHRDELADAALTAGFDDESAPVEVRLHAMIDAWFAYVEQHPYCWLLFRDTTGDPAVLELHTELQRRQRSADVALLREFAPGIPDPELEPTGEIIRSSLYGLALFWRDHPDTPRATLVASMERMTLGLLALGQRQS